MTLNLALKLAGCLVLLIAVLTPWSSRGRKLVSGLGPVAPETAAAEE
jgi:hypothetical protein